MQQRSRKTSEIKSANYAPTRLQSFHDNLLPMRAKKVQFFHAEKSNKCDQHITEGSFLIFSLN